MTFEEWQRRPSPPAMTEEEWLASTDPKPMLEGLRGQVSGRKLRLFAIACCRRVGHHISIANRLQAIEDAERFAEGMCSEDELSASCYRGWTGSTIRNHPIAFDADDYANAAAGDTAQPVAFEAADSVRNLAQLAADPDLEVRGEVQNGREQYPQTQLLRDIFGNPFRPVVVDPSWLTSDVHALATGIYQDRAFDRMPILADALEEAGCINAHVLLHCRQQSEHVRGCWVVDLLLGKS